MRHFLFHYLVVLGNVWELTLTDILCLLLSFQIYNHHVSIGICLLFPANEMLLEILSSDHSVTELFNLVSL